VERPVQKLADRCEFKNSEDVMKVFSKLAILAILALCSAVAFAGEKQSINVDLHQASTIAGVKVPAGEYKLVVERDGQKAKVALMHGKTTVVATDARFAEQSSFTTPIAVVSGADAKIIQIESSKLKGAVVFDEAAATSGAKSSGAK
jgi:hypothetical protein